MKIAITGASGNVGTALLRRLAADGADELIGISRRPPPRIAPYASASWHAVDLKSAGQQNETWSPSGRRRGGRDQPGPVQPSHDRELLPCHQSGRHHGRRVRQRGLRGCVTWFICRPSAPIPRLRGSGRTKAGRRGVCPPPRTASSTEGCLRIDAGQGRRSAHHSGTAGADLPTLRGKRGVSLLHRDTGAARTPAARGPQVRSSATQLAVQCVHANDVADALVRILRSGNGGAFNLATEPVLDRSQFAAVVGGVGPPAPPAVLRPIMDLAWRAHLQPTDPGWLDLAMSVPLMRTERARAALLGWAPTQQLTETLRDFLDALRRGAGGVGPVLYPRRPKTT